LLLATKYSIFPIGKPILLVNFGMDFIYGDNMKTPLALLLTFILTPGFTAQLTGQALTGIRISEIERQVDSVFFSAVKAAENLDYDKISKGVDDRYNAGFIVNNSYYPKYSSMIDILKANLRSGTKQTITIRDKKITVLSERIVLLTASGSTSVDLNNGQSFNANFLWSFVYEKFNNNWKVIQSHQSQAN
jgi:hypothetical protein